MAWQSISRGGRLALVDELMLSFDSVSGFVSEILKDVRLKLYVSEGILYLFVYTVVPHFVCFTQTVAYNCFWRCWR
jgi:hypothetical protein